MTNEQTAAAERFRLEEDKRRMARDIGHLSPVLKTAGAFLLLLCGRAKTPAGAYALADDFIGRLIEDVTK